jgi:hypothetical protein
MAAAGKGGGDAHVGTSAASIPDQSKGRRRRGEAVCPLLHQAARVSLLLCLRRKASSSGLPRARATRVRPPPRKMIFISMKRVKEKKRKDTNRDKSSLAQWDSFLFSLLSASPSPLSACPLGVVDSKMVRTLPSPCPVGARCVARVGLLGGLMLLEPWPSVRMGPIN